MVPITITLTRHPKLWWPLPMICSVDSRWKGFKHTQSINVHNKFQEYSRIYTIMTEPYLCFTINYLDIHRNKSVEKIYISWWRHQMETFSALLALSARISPVTGEVSSQGPETRSFDVSFDLQLNKRLSKESWGWWFKTPLGPLWPHCNVFDCL